jgi:hypothetical protein
MLRMPYSVISRRVTLVRTEVTEKNIASIIRVTRIGELGTTLAVTSKRSTLRSIRSSETSTLTTATWCNIPEDDSLHSHHRESLKFFTAYIIWKTLKFPCGGRLEFLLCIPASSKMRQKETQCPGVQLGQSRMRQQNVVMGPKWPGLKIDRNAYYKPFLSSERTPQFRIEKFTNGPKEEPDTKIGSPTDLRP